MTSALGQLGPAPVSLHLDIDVIDSAQLPGGRFPVGRGPSLAQIEECLAAACALLTVQPGTSQPGRAGLAGEEGFEPSIS